MANLLDLKNKINSTKNTGQITKALELVSASRQRRALDLLLNSRFLKYGVSELMTSLDLDSVLSSTEPTDLPKFFKRNTTNKDLIIVIMSHRGLCGPINSNLFFKVLQFKKSLGKQLNFISVNKIAQKYLKNFKENIISYFADIPENPTTDDILPLIEYTKSIYSDYENVYIAYSDFIKNGVIEPKIIKVLPIEKPKDESPSTATTQYTIEPDAISILSTLSSLYIDLELFEAILSSQTAEHSARMVAMNKATENVKSVVEDLTLSYNKERQAKITQAMAEISSNI